MGYHDLSSCTLTNDERVAEKNSLITNLESYYDSLSQKEIEFIDSISNSNFVSVKQLFWLRDINNKYS